MTRNKLTLLFAFFAFLSLSSQAQTLGDLKVLDQKYQACLDKGTNMLGCSQSYYTQMDSLLNVVYKNLRQPLSQTRKASLKTEQTKWLGKRDAYFKKVDAEYNAQNSHGSAGQDSRMIALDEKAKFVRERVEELVKKHGNS